MTDTTLIHVRVEPDLAAAIDRAADARQVKRSEIIRDTLRAGLLPPAAPAQPPSVARTRQPPRPSPAHPAPRIAAAGRTVQTYSKSEQVTRRDR